MKMLELSNVGKTFVMHLQGSIALPVIAGASFAVQAGECAILGGPSGIGKSSVLRMIFGNYRCDTGSIHVRAGDEFVDVARAEPRTIIALRRNVIGYVSQFLRAVPRVPAIDVVCEPLVAAGEKPEDARGKAADLLARLNVPSRLWELPPATFSGGEQQRINIARGFLPEFSILLLDEPTASLDAANRAVVAELVHEKKQRGVAIVAIAHDEDIRSVIGDTIVDVATFSPLKN